MSALECAKSALLADALEVQVAAFNLANVSTAGFETLRAHRATAVNELGVRISSLRRTQSGMRSENVDASATDISTEVTHLIKAKNSFIANTKVIGIVDDMEGNLFDLKA